jgi:predicted neuraminidase
MIVTRRGTMKMAAMSVVNALLGPAAFPAGSVDFAHGIYHAGQAKEEDIHDRTVVPFEGITPNRLVCDTTLRELPDRSWILFILAGGDKEPSSENHIALTRSRDKGKTWTPLETVNVGFPREGETAAQCPGELMILNKRCTLYFSTHSGNEWSQNWRSWVIHSDDLCQTWSKPEALGGRLQDRTFIRKHTITRDGRILLPFQHYAGPEGESWKSPNDRVLANPRNGVLMSSDGGKTWTEHGDVRLTEDDRYFGWAENNIVELSGGRIGMIIRGDHLGGVLYYAESTDGGRTWPEFARKTDIPNPGSKATLYDLGENVVGLLHNPNPAHRSPLSLWISFDGMKTWPFKKVLVKESSDGPRGNLNYPDGFVSRDRKWLQFAYDDNRHRAVYYGAQLPKLSGRDVS